jgi:hypothetical protein
MMVVGTLHSLETPPTAGASHPILAVVADAARDATRAHAARILIGHEDELIVAAVAGSERGWRLGERLAAEPDGVGYVLASGQPLSVAPQAGGGGPLLVVPCMYESEPVGVLELIGGAGAAPFPVASTDAALLFARVAGTTIVNADHRAASVPAPRELAAELVRVEASDPVRYASLARAVGALLS